MESEEDPCEGAETCIHLYIGRHWSLPDWGNRGIARAQNSAREKLLIIMAGEKKRRTDWPEK